MAKILDNHSLIFDLGEIHFYEKMWTPEIGSEILTEAESSTFLNKFYTISKKKSYSSIDVANHINKIYKENVSVNRLTLYKYFISDLAKKNNKIIPCDQTPRYIFFLKEIFEHFPNARILHMVRDPRDVLASQKMKWKVRKSTHQAISLREKVRRWSNYHPIVLNRMWLKAQKKGLEYAKDCRVKRIIFENLLIKPENTIRDICTFLNIQYNDQMLEVSGTRSPSANKIELSIDGISIAPIGRWRNRLKPEEVFITEYTISEYFDHFGFQRACVKPNILKIYLIYLVMLLKLPLSLILNFSNTKNLWLSIRRRFF